MLRKSIVVTTLITMLVVLAVGPAFAGKPPKNQAPTVTDFDVPDTSASPVPILIFTAEDSDGSVTGYLVTESPTPPAIDDNWTPTAPTEYTTSGVGSVTLYAWAKDDKDAVSDSMSDTVDIPSPPTGYTVVANSGGSYTDPLAAMTDLATWCGTPSAASPCLIKIMPGVYDIGASNLQMQEYVAIEGSGKGTTILTGSGSLANGGLVKIASHAELRGLTLEVDAGNGLLQYAGIYGRSVETTVADVEILCSGAAPGQFGGSGGCMGIYLSNDYPGLSPVRIQGVDINVFGGSDNYGIRSDSTNLIVQNTRISSTGGSYQGIGISAGGLHSPSVEIFNTHITVSGGNNGVWGISTNPELASLKFVASTLAVSNVNANIALYLYPGTDNLIKDSEISADARSVLYHEYQSRTPNTYITNTKLDGDIVTWDAGSILPGAPIKCFGVYDGNYDPKLCQ